MDAESTTITANDLVALTADIVSAHVSNNNVPVSELPALIASVHAAFATLGSPAVVEEAKLEPAVSIRSSVKPDAIVCLDCGYKGRMLKRHLNTAHNLSPAEYRSRWSLPKAYPMVAPNYTAERSALAHSIGLGRKPSKDRGEGGAQAGVAAKAPTKAKAKVAAKTKIAVKTPAKRGRPAKAAVAK